MVLELEFQTFPRFLPVKLQPQNGQNFDNEARRNSIAKQINPESLKVLTCLLITAWHVFIPNEHTQSPAGLCNSVPHRRLRVQEELYH